MELEQRIKLAEIDPEVAVREIGAFTIETVLSVGATGCVIGLSGGVDSTSTAAIIKTAFNLYNPEHKNQLELVGCILPSNVNNPKDAEDGRKVAERLGIKYKVISIEPHVKAFEITCPEAMASPYHRGNRMSEIRAGILHAEAASERKVVAGTGNKDEDFGIGYYTLFGDGAVHFSPIGELHKRHVRQVAAHCGFADLAKRIPTAGLEPGQTDFGDLGYKYETVELVSMGLEQGFTAERLYTQSQVLEYTARDIAEYAQLYGKSKFGDAKGIVDDILRRNKIASDKAMIVHPPVAPITVYYK